MIKIMMRPPAYNLEDQLAIVTGATGGFGKRMCRLLLACQADVAIVARDLDRMEKLAEELTGIGGRVVFFPHDVRDEPGPLFDEVERIFRRPASILINNAGIGHADKAHKCSAATFRDVLDVDLIAPFLLAQEAANRMTSAPQPIGGSIVNIASNFGQLPTKNMVAYAVAKAGLIQLTKCLALEWGELGIRVNALAPGWSLTPMTQAFLQSERGAGIVQDIPLRRFGHPADLDGALLLLVSDLGRYINGAVLTIDGGLSLGMRDGPPVKPKEKAKPPLVDAEELGASFDY